MRHAASAGCARAQANRLKIVIDPDRCPLTFAEFTLKELERDKEGNWIDEIAGGNDHSIDAVRYAMVDDILRGRAGVRARKLEFIGLA